MSPEKEKELHEAFEKFMAISLNQLPVDGLEELVDDKVMGYGTTIDEQVHDLEGYIRLIKGQEEQAKSAELEFQFDRKQVHQRYSKDGNTAVFVELIEATISSDEIKNQLTLRVSSIMDYVDGKWKLIHWHGSVPSDTEEDSWHVNEWLKEKEKLEKLVAEQIVDLQQKNRELEIEAALERVRSRTMIMQQSSELSEVGNLLFQQLKQLGIHAETSWLWFINPETDEIEIWTTHENKLAEPVKINPADLHTVQREIEAWKNKEPIVKLSIPENEAIQAINQFFGIEICHDSESEYFHLLQIRHNYGFLGLGTWKEATEEKIKVYTRFAKVFEQTYTRFLDLKKAEEQARKSQIELSLERIRTQATSMQKSQDLLDIVVTMHAEFTSLGHEAHYFWHMRWLEGTYQKAMTSGDGSRIGNVMELPRGFHQNEAMIEWEQNEEPIGVFTFDADGAIDYVDRIISEGRFDEIDHNSPGPDDIRAIGGLTFVMARTTHGEIGYSLPGVVEQPPEDDLKTLVRFAGVFDLAYRRFEDLLKAEQQAYESKVEASLERVRGMAAAMNHSDDLKQIAEEMFKEMEMLRINPLRYGLAMIDGANKEAELWASTVNDGHYLDLLGNLSLTWHPMLLKAYDAWDAQYEEFIYILKGKELSDYYEKIGTINPEIPDLGTLVNPDNEVIHYCCFFPFKSGTMYAFTDGEPDEEGKSILKRFANVFEQAFARFEDLQKTETQARMIREERDRLDQALKELYATKDQLVQQEKLASLGQLTAGIAHEIKNPLNFVNNFSELSVELIEEVREEIQSERAKGKSEKLDEALEILSDIEANLKKIHEHGSRADSIVKSMLEHSRGGTGKLEPTNLNALVKEFVNLSFHGMRASKNPINVDLQFELDELIGEVPLIGEDFSRVIVNLSNNAFDAMREKLSVLSNSDSHASEKGEKYAPRLNIRTFTKNQATIIEIEDNGLGIPDDIKDKILQPFFTTKKGTEGTGLGLSITNDIIKAHGGVLEVSTNQNEGTCFTIKLS